MAETPALQAEADAWEGQGRQDGSAPAQRSPQLSVEGFVGPLDFLLEMIRH